MTQYGEINGVPVAFSRHSLKRADEMEISAEEIERAFTRPQNKVPSTAYPGCVNYRGERITLAIDPEQTPIKIITVLWNSKENWDKYFRTHGDTTDRKHRPWQRGLRPQ